MKKDAFYFPHFANARHDRKIKRLIKELGIEGYGIYFMLLEVLREQVDFKYPLCDVDLLADEFGTSEPKLRTVISQYELFVIDEDSNFFSIKQIYYLQPYLEKTQRARLAAEKRWSNTNAMQMHSKCNADAMQVKESKVKERKVFTAPTRLEVNEFFKEKGYLGGDRAFDYYDSAGWKDSQGKAVRNWKQKMISVWFKPENKIQEKVDRYAGSRNDLKF